MEKISNYFPPDTRGDLPIVITNQVFNSGAIKRTINRILSNPKVDTLVAVAPFISSYFVNLLSKETTVKNLVLLINREDLNPNYVDNAIKMLKNVKFHVEIRERPPKSVFIHMKVMVPYVKVERTIKVRGVNQTEFELFPFCVISGSVNFTKNGISISDEALTIFRDEYSIRVFLDTYKILMEGTLKKYSSRKPFVTTKRSGG